ncbi:MAG: hypothetical protein D6732_23350 [Methanobacteriota archaeon]|nr:MAG: hypothetical protein D6732_23350 [Euryarchaeota archaeon]
MHENTAVKTFDIDAWHGIGAILFVVIYSIIFSNATNYVMDSVLISFITAWFVTSTRYSMDMTDVEQLSEANLLRGASILIISGVLSSVGFTLGLFTQPKYWHDISGIFNYKFYLTALFFLPLFGFMLHECNRAINNNRNPSIPLVVYASIAFVFLVVALSFNVYNLVNPFLVLAGVFLGGYFSMFIERSSNFLSMILMVVSIGIAPNLALVFSKTFPVAVFLFYFAFVAGSSFRKMNILIICLIAFSFVAFNGMMVHLGWLDEGGLSMFGNTISGIGWCILCATISLIIKPVMKFVSMPRKQGLIIRFLSWVGRNYPSIIASCITMFGIVAAFWIDSILIKAGNIGIDGWLLFVFMRWHKMIFWTGWEAIIMIQVALLTFSLAINVFLKGFFSGDKKIVSLCRDRSIQ